MKREEYEQIIAACTLVDTAQKQVFMFTMDADGNIVELIEFMNFKKKKKEKANIKEKSILYTYLMYDHNTGFYKIGKSKNPKFRENTLQSEKPTISLLFTFESDIEKELHKKFSSKRIRGEWFELNDNDVDYLTKLSKSNK